MLKTALVTDRRYLRHFAGHGHPECPERIEVMMAMVEGLRRPDLRFITPREASLDELALCHLPDYISLVERTSKMEHYAFDPDTRSSPESFATAVLASGGVLTAVEAVLDGAADNAFAIVRPPGHHAPAGRAMGFCFFNNVAIAASYLLKLGLGRVLVVDWDLHHGNGTQEIFYESPEVLYFSIHQFPHYPGTGSLSELGAGRGVGYTVNAPVPPTFGDDEYLRVFDELLMPVASKFRPDFVLISAGFDCHLRDPLGAMRVSEAGFTAMTHRAMRLAAQCCRGKLVAALEGGYDLEALASSGQAVIEQLGHYPEDHFVEPIGGERATDLIERARRNLAPLWTPLA